MWRTTISDRPSTCPIRKDSHGPEVRETMQARVEDRVRKDHAFAAVDPIQDGRDVHRPPAIGRDGIEDEAIDDVLGVPVIQRPPA